MPEFLHECMDRPAVGSHYYHGLEFGDHYVFVDAGFGECIRVDPIVAYFTSRKSGFEYEHLIKGK